MSCEMKRLLWIIGLMAVGIWLFMGVLLPIALPFLLGALLARVAEPAVAFLCTRLRFSRCWAVAVAVTGVFVLFMTVLSFLLALLVRQVQDMARLLPQFLESFSHGADLLQQWLAGLASRLPDGLGDWASHITEQIFTSGNALVEQVVAMLPQILTGLIGSLSNGLLGLLTTVISAYMIANRLPWLRQQWQQHQPLQWQQRWKPWLQECKKALGGWLLAEVKLAGVAFVLMVAGFFILRIPNVLLWAGLITFVDVFPVLGVGTVLVPWALVCFLQGNSARAVGLLGLYGVIWVIRSVLEPRWIGKGMGLDPLITLVATYGGWKLWGVGGMLVAPILALMVSRTWDQFRRQP